MTTNINDRSARVESKMELLGQGRTAEVFLTQDGKALKLFRAAIPEHVAHREAQVARIVSEQCSLAPAYHGMTTVEDRVGLLFERIDGAVISETLISGDYTVDDFARELAQLHLEIHAASGDGLHDTGDILESKIAAYVGISDRGKRRLLRYLDRDRTSGLCHGDLHPENLIRDPENRLRPIDWTNAYRGNPLSDVARTIYLLRSGLRPGTQTVADEERPLREQIIATYSDEYFQNDQPDDSEWAAWQTLVMVNRYTEGIDAERPTIEKAVALIQANHPELR